MNVRFMREAREEFAEAALWYEAREPGLGWRFRDEIERMSREIGRQPAAWRVRPGGYCRADCAVFPYYLAFEKRPDEIIIYAVAHAHRHPEYWKKRID